MAKFVGERKVSATQKLERDLDVLQIMGRRVPSSGNLAFIQAAILEKRGKPHLKKVADHHRHSRGNQQVISACHFCHHQHGGDGHTSSCAENRCHAYNHEDRGELMQHHSEAAS